jgi:hypothetical protein
MPNRRIGGTDRRTRCRPYDCAHEQDAGDDREDQRRSLVGVFPAEGVGCLSVDLGPVAALQAEVVSTVPTIRARAGPTPRQRGFPVNHYALRDSITARRCDCRCSPTELCVADEDALDPSLTMSEPTGMSRAETARMLRRAGYSDEFITEVLSHLPDPINLPRDERVLQRYGLSCERLMDRMGGSP